MEHMIMLKLGERLVSCRTAIPMPVRIRYVLILRVPRRRVARFLRAHDARAAPLPFSLKRFAVAANVGPQTGPPSGRLLLCWSALHLRRVDSRPV
eukprot:9494426-Pyramimonas_sp.AAC.1